MRRRKCRDCEQIIHVRTDRENRKKYLLTAEEAERRAATDARLARERRNEEWKQLSGQVQVAMQAGDWKSLQAAYQQQARILFVEGRPHRHVAQEATRARLMYLLELGVLCVKVMTVHDQRVCTHCQSLNRKVFTIQKALEAMPIPGPNCTDGNEQNPHSGRCRCVYIAVNPGLREQPWSDDSRDVCELTDTGHDRSAMITGVVTGPKKIYIRSWNAVQSPHERGGQP